MIHKWELAGLGKAPFMFVGLTIASEPDQCFLESYRDNAEFEDYGLNHCHVCGRGLRNNFLIDSSDGKHFTVGCDCIKDSGDTGMIDDLKRTQKTRRQIKKANERKIQREQWKHEAEQWKHEAEQKLIEFYQLYPNEVITLIAYTGTNEFIINMVDVLYRWGSLFDKQMIAALKSINKEIERNKEKELAEPIPVTDDRIKITGEILSINFKTSYDHFGNAFDRRVAVIKDNRGFCVWGTMNHGDVQDKIEFMCRVKVSDKDSKFGFFKRPTKIKLNQDNQK